ncbi:PDZ domain-containing protein [bacterium]|nr:PDZ domain-containing protein [bacterium]
MKLKALVFVFLCCGTVYGQTVKYYLSMPKPQNHYFHVEMVLEGFNEKSIDVSLPVWSPGSYLVREFSKNINLVTATDGSGKELQLKKTKKNTWSIAKGKSSEIRIAYDVYAFELSVRTSFLDLTHGFVSGSGVFMFVEDHLDISGDVVVVPYDGFSEVSTALPRKERNKPFVFSYSDYDHLVDCPIEIGNQLIFDFKASGVNHTVAIYGEGNFEIETLKRDMSKVIEEETKVFGQNPNKEYLFIIHNVVDGQGGLEHENSTTLSVNRWTYSGNSYVKFLSLVAHEYFHLWNVKRIRPFELGPFDYNKENYTDLLWVMEGFTSYYDELLLLRAGYYSQSEFLAKMESSINYVEGSVGARLQPVAHASYDAWIKAYRPNENSSNTTMTYYTRGSILAAFLDVKIIRNSKGERGLDHFLQHMYEKFYVKADRGFTSSEFKQELERFTGENLDSFYAYYIDGTAIPTYSDLFEGMGVSVTDVTSTKPDFGATLRSSGGKAIISRIRTNSAAEDAGLSVNDEIIGCNGYRVNKSDIEGVMRSLRKGDELDLLISRDEILFSVSFKMTNYAKPRFLLNLTNEENKLRDYWLR